MPNDEEKAAQSPRFGPSRAPFGLARENLNRVEVMLWLRGGAQMGVSEQVDEEVTPEWLDVYAAELGEQIAAGAVRAFKDTHSAPGVRSWVRLEDVVAFSVRQARA